jgi:NitT/TauT family transport system substrate-binding protein
MKIIAKVALATLVALPASEASAQKLTFTLNWVAGGDHAPYFYAQKMGLYKQAGLDVDFETGCGSAASAQKVGAGPSRSSGFPTWRACCCSAARASTMSG